MRNWRWRRKGGGGENAFDERAVAASRLETATDDEGVAIATATGTVFSGEGAGARVASRSRLVLGLVSRQLSAQQGIDACIDAAPPAGLLTQHAPTAGMAAKTSSATATTVLKCFVDMLNGLTILLNSRGSIGISAPGRYSWPHMTA